MNNSKFFVWTDQAIDWLLRASLTNPLIKTWCEDNKKQWTHIFHWARDNIAPPSQFDFDQVGQARRMKKYKKESNIIEDEEPKESNLHLAVQKYRFKRLLEMAQKPQDPDEYAQRAIDEDIKQMDFHDYKWEWNTQVEIWTQGNHY